MAHGGDAVPNAAEHHGDRDFDLDHAGEGKEVGTNRNLTTDVRERSAKHGEARGGRNRRRRRTGVEEGIGGFPELHVIPACVTRRGSREDPGAPSGPSD